MTIERKRFFADTFIARTETPLLSLPRQLSQNQTVHNICTSKPKPVLGLKPKPVWTNGTWH